MPLVTLRHGSAYFLATLFQTEITMVSNVMRSLSLILRSAIALIFNIQLFLLDLFVWVVFYN